MVRVFGWTSCVFGSAVLMASVASVRAHPVAILLVIYGGAFLAAGVWLLGNTFTFDRARRVVLVRRTVRRREVPFELIVGLEVSDAGEFDSGSDSSETWRSGQLEIVLAGGAPRVLVARQHDHDDLTRKAGVLAELVGVPLTAPLARASAPMV